MSSTPSNTTIEPSHAVVIDDTRRWVEKAVIGLNLCPFAKAVHAKGQLHFAVTMSSDPETLLAALDQEITDLLARDESVRSTTLLIAPQCLTDFLDFNDFLEVADGLIHERRLEGVLQVASFHPQFQFAGTEADDITNATNRAPYPTLHLLREASVDVAVTAFPEAESIYLRNIETLTQLGDAGWRALALDATLPALMPPSEQN